MSAMHPDYLDGLRAWDRGEPFDPSWRAQKRRGWSQARENAGEKAAQLIRQAADSTVRLSERGELLHVCTDLQPGTIADLMRLPSDMLEAMGYGTLARYVRG